MLGSPSPASKYSADARGDPLKVAGEAYHLRCVAPEPTQENRRLHTGCTKLHSAQLIQLLTGKTDFKEFLYNQRVPEYGTSDAHATRQR